MSQPVYNGWHADRRVYLELFDEFPLEKFCLAGAAEANLKSDPAITRNGFEVRRFDFVAVEPGRTWFMVLPNDAPTGRSIVIMMGAECIILRSSRGFRMGAQNFRAVPRLDGMAPL
jgi:hypothetical protein